MGFYNAAARVVGTPNVTSPPICDVKAFAPTGTKLTELTVITAINNAINFLGLGRSSAELLQIAPANFLATETVDLISTTTFGTAWSSAPAIPTNIFRRITPQAQGGTGVIWSFPRGLTIPSLGSIILFYTPLTGQTNPYDVSAEIEE